MACTTLWPGAARFTLAALVIVLAGCATPADPRPDAKYQEHAYAAARPVVRPARSFSSFSDSLGCMDHLLRSAQVPTTLITSKQLPDYSGRVAVSTKEMVITALSQMSRVSNAFRFVDYEVDIARQDTVQNLTTLLLNNNQVQLQRPALYFSGAIAFVDQNVINNRFDVGASGSRLDAAYSKNRNATLIGLELHLGDFRTRTLIPGMDSANEIVVGNGGQGFDLAGRISRYGVQFNIGREYSMGTGAAVRTLVELGTIELVGKWARLPYWQCLTLDQTHPEFQRQLRDWYEEGSAASRNELVKRSLASRGYLGPDAAALPPESLAVRDAIAQFQADAGMVVTGIVDFSTYEHALGDFVGLGSDGKLVRIGWPASQGELLSVAGAGRRAALPGAGGPGGARAVELQVENIKADRSSFEVGEQVFVSAVISRAGWLSCYYADSRGVMRLLPLGPHPSVWTPANHAVRVPDWMSPNPGFILDAAQPGREEMACFATDRDGSALPAPLQGPGLTPIAGFRDLAEVRRAYAQALGEGGFAHGSVGWQVVPRRAAATR